MRPPPIDDPTVRDSFIELRHILRWLEERGEEGEPPRAILVGGWAVHAYNPYYGSYDIDLVTNSRTRGSLMHFLRTERSFEKEKDPLTGRTGVVLPVPQGRPVRIDFAYMSGEDSFEGTNDPMPLEMVVQHSGVENIGGWRIPLPRRTMLIVLKLKAAWDRRWRLDHDTSREPRLEEEKLVKDGADVMAIVDSFGEGVGVEVGLLGDVLARYPYLREVLAGIGGDRREVMVYDRDPGPVREGIKRMLELTAP